MRDVAIVVFEKPGNVGVFEHFEPEPLGGFVGEVIPNGWGIETMTGFIGLGDRRRSSGRFSRVRHRGIANPGRKIAEVGRVPDGQPGEVTSAVVELANIAWPGIAGQVLEHLW